MIVSDSAGKQRMMRARWRRLGLTAVLAALAWAPATAAAEFTSFELPSRHVDVSTPGGKLAGGRTVPKINVMLPDGYDADSKRGYPVLWLLHGANGGTDSWVPGIADLLPDFPAIVVMPDGGPFGMYTNWWNGGARGGPAWATYHLKVLRRVIEKRYPIRPERRWHAIGGISMGGQGTLRYAAMLPGYFGSAAGFSAAVPDMQSELAQLGVSVLPLAGGANGVSYEALWGSPSSPYAEGNSPQALASNYGHSRLYLSSGDGVNCPGDPQTATFALDVITETGIRTQQAPFAAAARSAGADVTERETCGVHTFGVWDRAIPDAREWGFFEPVAERPRAWAYRTIATSGEMWGLRYRFAEPPADVVGFERAGRTLTAAGTGKVRIGGPRGCRLTADLPFELSLPRACRHSP